MKNFTINILRDNDRTVVIIEGPDVHDRDDLAYLIGCAYMMPDEMADTQEKELREIVKEEKTEAVKLETVEGLEPVKTEPQKMPTPTELEQMHPYHPSSITISDGRHKGLTPEEVLGGLTRDGFHEEGLLDLFDYCKKEKGRASQDEITAIVTACKQYMRQAPQRITMLTSKGQRLEYLRHVAKLVHLDQYIKDRYGYNSIEMAERHLPDDRIDDMLRYAAQKLAERGSK